LGFFDFFASEGDFSVRQTVNMAYFGIGKALQGAYRHFCQADKTG